MAEIQNKPHLPQPQPSCFLGCFGFSKKFSEKKFYEEAKSGGRKKSRRFSWSRFRMKKSANIKTVPVDVEPIKKTYSLKPKSKVKSKSDKLAGESEAPATGHQPPRQIVAAEAVTSDQISVEEPPQETTYEPAEDINLENRKHLDHSGFIKPDTSQKRLSFCRKIDAIRTGFSQPDSPVDTQNPNRNRNRAASTSLSHSASFPAPNLSKRVVSPPAPSRFTPQKTRKEQPREFDPVIGVSIITVTLIIMFLWGRLCAILCTSAWFYFVPRLRTGISSDDAMKNGSDPGDPDLNSEEYKKKVVLEGFLERKHHNRNNSLVIL